ncbi:hypothetical protein MA04_00649 [Alcanivorax balearicus MACL04]|uniref:Uncharacterized protein n=1 Tax=Alloalcanivorax balearicus MACL04 TaxID=1177182 RepID=A0ABT2QUZ6_9GAMM|nr:hypothetical protein [Alloalcanivorax balearicus]MCU5781349.1 hypothetical protein [Alloalcanivorax balearicus MACL04]
MESAVFEIEVTSWGYLAVVFWSLFPLLFSVGYTVAFRRRLYHRFWFAVLATVCGYVGYAGIQIFWGRPGPLVDALSTWWVICCPFVLHLIRAFRVPGNARG